MWYWWLMGSEAVARDLAAKARDNPREYRNASTLRFAVDSIANLRSKLLFSSPVARANKADAERRADGIFKLRPSTHWLGL